MGWPVDFRSLDLSALSNDELASVLVEALPWYCECARMHAHLGGTAVEAVGHLVEWYRKRFPDAAESEPYRLVQGQSNLSVEKGHLLWQLQHNRRLKLSPPEFLGACEEPPSEEEDYLFWGPLTPLEAPKGEVRGVGASPGIIRGRARVAVNLDKALELQPGEILVCSTTNPQWTPLFAVGAGLVSDRGGALCHGAVVAREYGLPAVVGTLIGTKKIRTGQLIEVDGQSGVI